MLVLGDEGHYHGRFPWVTGAIVVANVIVFVAQMIIGPAFSIGYSLVPAEITTFQDVVGTRYRDVKIEVSEYRDDQGGYHRRFANTQIPIEHYPGPTPIWLTLVTSMFMHVSVAHLVGNMWFLLVFGRNVECALGHLRFLALFLVWGVCAGLAHVASDPDSIVPCLGASGAISGIMGAYLAIHPLNKIMVWFVFGVFEAPALIIVGLWLLLQYLSAFITLDTGVSDGVAYWNHLGGFSAGLISIRSLVFWLRLWPRRRPDPEPVPASDLGSAVRPGAPDPYGGFLTVQVLRKMQEKSN
jgi:membrane associated rhomboid family serine protease